MSNPRTRRREEGAAAVEFALLVPILLLLLFGIVDFALAFNAQVTVTHAAREGVRVQALGATPAETTAAAEGASIPREVSVTTEICEPGEPTTVTVTTQFDYVTPLSGLLQMLGNDALLPTTLSGTGVMRCGG